MSLIRSRLPGQVYRRAVTGWGTDGQPTHGVPQRLCRGRWTPKRRLVQTADANQVTSTVTLTMEPSFPVAVGDSLSPDGSTWYTVLQVLPPATGLGGKPELQEVLL